MGAPGEAIWETTGSDLAERVQEHLRQAKNAQDAWRTEATECYGFVAGEQWSAEDKGYLAEQQRPVVTFNRVGPIINMVSGQEINNRQSVRYIPRTVGESRVNELLTAAADWVRDECDADDEESDAFLDAIITGIGCTETRLAYDTDLDGKIVIERVPPLELYYDPTSTKQNLSDARWIVREKVMARSQAEEMWPGKDFESADIDDEVEQPVDIVEAAFYRGNQADKGEFLSDSVRIVEYQWWEMEHVTRMADPQTGQLVTIPQAKFALVEQAAKAAGIKFVKQKRRIYRRAFLSGDTVLETGDCPDPASFTYKFITAQRDRKSRSWYGLVRPLMDPQRWANKFFSQVLNILNSNSKGGIMAEADAFLNPRDAEQDWASPDSITMLAPGGAAKIQPKPIVEIPAAAQQLMSYAIQSMTDVTGVNQALMGVETAQNPAVLENTRKQAGIMVLSYLFDSLKRYRKEHGRLLLYLIQHYISDGRLVRIVGPSSAQFVPLIHQPGVDRYDVIVDEAPTSPNVKERTWAILVQMMPMLMKMPAPPQLWAQMLAYAPLPETLKEQITQILNQPQPPNPDVIEKQNAAKNQEAQAMLHAAQAQQVLGEAQLAPMKAYVDAMLQQHQIAASMAKVQAENASTAVDLQSHQMDARMKALEMAHKLVHQTPATGV